MTINGYTLQGEWITTNSGFSKWGFANKNGREYFIKELVTPVYPVDPAVMTPGQFESRRTYCKEYEKRFEKFYTRINEVSRGNLVRIHEFFRHGSRYYVVTEKVRGSAAAMQQISQLPENKKLLLMKTVAQSFCDLHSVGIIHFDVKPANILLNITGHGNYVARVIDFDSGLFREETLEDRELGGDLTYLAPETFLGMIGEDSHPDEKADVFALGLVFHEYYFGRLPAYSEKGYEYPFEEALEEDYVHPDTGCGSRMVADLIQDMLIAEPEKRPAIEDVLTRINNFMGFQQQESSKIWVRELELTYGGSQGRAISLTPERIRWWNTAPSTAWKENCGLADSYFAHQETPMTPELYQELMESVMAAGLVQLLSAPKPTGRLIISGAFNQSLQVCNRDGTMGTYSAKGAPLEPFNKIVAILEKHCTFPRAEDHRETTPKVKPEETPKTETPVNSGPEPAAWFHHAGDL
ncbi:MAG: hypothetical protein E7413_01620 [Ruminococcaceae bacterium]|nr:hypothetical protein [Oscillospiraceae bacterium]